jgi:hypothetical protein
MARATASRTHARALLAVILVYSDLRHAIAP